MLVVLLLLLQSSLYFSLNRYACVRLTLRVRVLLSKAVLPSSEQMHQCVSLAHLGSCSPGSTGLGCNVSVKVRVRVELMRVGVRPAVATSHFIRPQASQRGFASNKPQLIDPRSMLRLLDRWSESESVRKRWPHSTDLGQNPNGRLDQGVKNVHVCTVRIHLLRVHSLLRRKRAHGSLCRSTNQRAHNRNVYWSSSVCVTRARLHQAPFTWSLPFHTQMTFKELQLKI